MSLFDNDFSLNGSKRISGNLDNVTDCVNPQYTDKRYGTIQLEFMTPAPSPTDATPRRESFALSYFSGSSGSSFMSHSGCGTPSQSTPGSSTSTSRRQSMLLPESQQYYLSASSSSPSIRPQRPNRAAATDQCLLQESSPGSYMASTDTASLITDSAAACTPGSEFTMVIDDYTEKAPRQGQSYGHQNDTSLYERAAQPAEIDLSTRWGRDSVADFNSSIAVGASHAFDFSQTLFDHTQPTIFERTTSQSDAEAYQPANDSGANAPLLAPAFEWCPAKYDTEAEFVDGDMESNIATAGRSCLGDTLIRQPLDDSSHHLKRSRGSLLKNDTFSIPCDVDLECDHAASPIFKNRNRKQREGQGAMYKLYPRHKPHRCPFRTDTGELCDYACHRPEHLRRHQDSRHRGTKTIMLPCAFDGCKDRKTDKHRQIISRFDNLKAHYTKTHFKYGSSEKGGKNERKSMKAAHEMGLSIYDHRWTLLLEGKMDVNHEIKEFLHVWKMLGYSIRETRDIRVKDVVLDWQGSEEETLQKYDARWKALWNRTLTFDQAMNVGRDMKESEAQGLLGVTMLETEEMGIKELDVRWVQMDNGRMSVEQSEKLGVKQRNPVWKGLVARRKARGWVEKL